MTSTTISLQRLVREVQRGVRERRLTFLIGAGVSMLGPSSLPSGNQLKDMAVAGLCTTRQLRAELRRLRKLRQYWTITPEIVFQRLHASLGHGTLPPFFDVLRHCEPNSAHRWLARMARDRGCRLFTTNFDLLLEQAGAPHSTVEHLHGRIDQPQSLVTRINQVGRGLPANLEEHLTRHLKGRTLCVLGYSGNDEDIRRAIERSDVHQIFWLTASKADWAWANISHFAIRHNVLGAIGNLRTLIAALDGGRHDWTAVSTDTEAARVESIRKWALAPRVVDRYACLSELLFEIEDYRGALALSERALRFARGTELAGWFRIQMANARKVLGQFDEAERDARNALKINRRLGEPFDIAGAYNNLGTLLTEKKEPDPGRGLRALRKGLSVLEDVDLRLCNRRRREALNLLKGRILNNIGLACEWIGKTRDSMRWYRRALIVKARSGDVLGEAKTAGNLAIVAKALGDPVAPTARDRALFLMNRYDRRLDKAYVLRRLGVLSCEQGDKREGLALLKEAKDLYESIPGSSFDLRATARAMRQYSARSRV